MKSLLPQGAYAPHVYPRPRKRLARCTLDCGSKTSESPALRGFVGGLRALATAALYLVLLSNGLRHSKNLPVKFDFSPIDTPANMAKKLPPQRCSKPLFIAFFNFSHKWPTFAFTGESGYTLAFRRRIAHTAKQGAFPPSATAGLCVASELLLFRHAFIYIHFPVHCEPPLSAERKIRRNCRHKFYPQPFLIPVFNFSHKRPTFAFTGESGYTLGFRRRIAHSGLHAETGGVSDGGGIITLGAFRTFTNIPGPGVLQKNAESLRNSDALMRVAVPKASRPRWAAHTYAVNTSIFPAEFFSHSQKAGKKSHSLMFHIHVFDCTA